MQQQLISDDGHARVVCERCAIADRPHTRLRGLLGRTGLETGEGVLLRPTPSVHTCFMRFPIDVVFLDAGLRVLSIRPALRPWRFAGRRGARSVLELAAGEAARRGIRPGTSLKICAGPRAGNGDGD